MVEINRRNQQRFIRNKQSGDMVLDSTTGDTSLDNEDKVIMGNYTDEGTSGNISKFEVMFAGIGNEVQGEDASLYGANVKPKTERGKNALTHRQQRRRDFL